MRLDGALPNAHLNGDFFRAQVKREQGAHAPLGLRQGRESAGKRLQQFRVRSADRRRVRPVMFR